MTATIVTSGFVKAAEAHRKLLKRPDLSCLVVPHPLVSMAEADLEASADALYDGVVEAISSAGVAAKSNRANQT